MSFLQSLGKDCFLSSILKIYLPLGQRAVLFAFYYNKIWVTQAWGILFLTVLDAGVPSIQHNSRRESGAGELAQTQALG